MPRGDALGHACRTRPASAFHALAQSAESAVGRNNFGLRISDFKQARFEIRIPHSEIRNS
jgi:hypothetical protein